MKNLEGIFFSFLLDNAFSVRELGVEKLASIAQEFKADWVVNVVIPKLKEVNDQPKQGYLYRMTVLCSYVSIISTLSKEQINTYILPTMLKACKDTVPNVRFGVLKIIKKICKFIDPAALQKQFKPYLFYIG